MKYLRWDFNEWGEWWGSNPRPPEPQPGALPTELHSPCQWLVVYELSDKMQ